MPEEKVIYFAYLSFPSRWLFNHAMCTFYAFCGVLFGLCSLTSLTALSTVCCMKVCYPAYGRCWEASLRYPVVFLVLDTSVISCLSTTTHFHRVRQVMNPLATSLLGGLSIREPIHQMLEIAVISTKNNIAATHFPFSFAYAD